ncbi:hypothetical protein Bca4012_075839 [Brassica carinata]
MKRRRGFRSPLTQISPYSLNAELAFPNGDIGKVTLTYEGLHRYCFTCKLISHDENTRPQLTPAEREIKRKQRLENHAANEQQRLPIQGSQGFSSGNQLKRPRSPLYERHHSPLATSRNGELYRVEKRRKGTTSLSSTREARDNGYHTRDHKSSGRQDNRHSHRDREVWSRLEIPAIRGDSHRGQNNNQYSRGNPRTETPRPNFTFEWRPRQSLEDPKYKTSNNTTPRHAEYERRERSRVTYDSQKTISDNRMSLESGEIDVTRITYAKTAADAEEERIRRLKGKAIITDTPTPQHMNAHNTSLKHQGANLIIPGIPPEAPLSARQEQRYEPPSTEQGDKLLELEAGIDQDLDVPLTDLELAEVDNLVLETERLEMDENMIDENMIDIDNDDLFGDSSDLDAEKIEAISQLSPANAERQEATHSRHQLLPAKIAAPPPQGSRSKEPTWPLRPIGSAEKEGPSFP